VGNAHPLFWSELVLPPNTHTRIPEGFYLAGIKILHHAQGASSARGIAVVIDVLRAFSTACYLAAGGARRIWAVGDAESAQRLAQIHEDAVLIGERDGRRIPGFQLGNSPYRVRQTEWSGRTVLFTTSNGTRGLAAAWASAAVSEVLCGSFVNAGAVIDYIRRRAPADICLVCMGSNGHPAIEDTLCALYLRAALVGRPMDYAPLRIKILRDRSVDFQDRDSEDMPAQDLELCLALDRFAFVLRAAPGEGGSVALERLEPPVLYSACCRRQPPALSSGDRCHLSAG